MYNPEEMTVTELNMMISAAIKSDPRTRSVQVIGEVSGFRHHIATCHWFFSLKDADSAIPCVMYRQNATRTSIHPKDGDSLCVNGYVDMYVRDGRVQLYVTAIRPKGIGNLFEQFELLKKKLSAEGLFDFSRKRMLPMVPRKVAVVTSESGAALHDILNVSGKRYPGIPLVIVPAGVQGIAAAAELAEAIYKAGKIPNVDVLIVARGGGSPEDLWCFNTEVVARAVANCPVPVVSGVGHETDTTICDFAADVRASTPSNAAEIVIPDRNEILGRISLLHNEIRRNMTEKIHILLLQIQNTSRRMMLLSPEKKITSLSEKVFECRRRMFRELQRITERKENEIGNLRDRLGRLAVRLIEEKEIELQHLNKHLKAVSPFAVLERGYALIYTNENGKLITRAEKAEEYNDMTVRFYDGTVLVHRKEQNKNHE